MDEQLILETAAASAPALRALACEILEAEARHLGVSLDVADVLLRRAEGMPALQLTAAVDQLLEHLAAIEGTAPADQGIVAVLARAGAQMLMSGIEVAESADGSPHWTRVWPIPEDNPRHAGQFDRRS